MRRALAQLPTRLWWCPSASAPTRPARPLHHTSLAAPMKPARARGSERVRCSTWSGTARLELQASQHRPAQDRRHQALASIRRARAHAESPRGRGSRSSSARDRRGAPGASPGTATASAAARPSQREQRRTRRARGGAALVELSPDVAALRAASPSRIAALRESTARQRRGSPTGGPEEDTQRCTRCCSARGPVELTRRPADVEATKPAPDLVQVASSGSTASRPAVLIGDSTATRPASAEAVAPEGRPPSASTSTALCPPPSTPRPFAGFERQ